MGFLERDLEDWLYLNPSACGMKKWLARQLTLPSGVLDLLGEDFDGYAWVFELKAVSLDSSALTQVCRYAADIETIVNQPVLKACVGPGEVRDSLQFEADALGVKLHLVKAAFEVSGPWGWTKDALCSFSDRYEQVRELPTIRNYMLEDDIRSLLVSLDVPEDKRKLALDISRDYIQGGWRKFRQMEPASE